MRILDSKIVIVSMFAVVVSFGGGCTDADRDDPDEDLYPVDRDELADESIADEVDTAELDITEQPPSPLICVPDEIHGEATRLSLDANGRVRARGTVWSNVGPCFVSVNVRLTRDGRRIDSQQKDCSAQSCTSRLLSAGNPAGAQRFCATVRQTATGSVLDRECITR